MQTYENNQKTKVIQQRSYWYVLWIGQPTALEYTGANLWRKDTGIKLFLKDGRP